MRIKKSEFKKWLFAQPGERIIEASNPSKCFICSFLKETKGFNNPRVDMNSFETTLYSTPTIIPEWLINLLGDYVKGMGTSVSVSQMQVRWKD